MSGMFFSVLIPVYNTAPYLRECMQSVLNQTFRDYEIVLLDDGSTDDSGAICDEYREQYPSFVRVIHKQNEGLMMTRRRGFQEAKGEYFICLDSDDYLYDPSALDRIRDIIIREKCDLVLFDYIRGESAKKDDHRASLFDYETEYVFDDKERVYERLLTSNQMNNIWLKCPHRSIVDIDVDYTVWKNEICRAEDLFQSYPMLNNAKRIGYIAEPLYYYRWAPNSISNKCKKEYYGALRRIYLREDDYLDKWSVNKEVKEKAFTRRITGICTVIIRSYFSDKKNGRLDDWKEFLTALSNDCFFTESISQSKSGNVILYYKLLCKLILENRIWQVMFLIDVVSFVTRIKKCIIR